MASARNESGMDASATGNPEEALQLKRALEGDRQAWASLLAAYRPRLRRMVAVRLHPLLRGRIDPSDVLQDAFVEATERLGSYAEKSDLPLFLWLRWLTAMRIKRIHRDHLDVKGRDPRREVSLYGEGMPGVSSAALAEQLLGGDTRPNRSWNASAAASGRAWPNIRPSTPRLQTRFSSCSQC